MDGREEQQQFVMESIRSRQKDTHVCQQPAPTSEPTPATINFLNWHDEAEAPVFSRPKQCPGKPDKPVIYLYDRHERAFDVCLRVKIGALKIVYPEPALQGRDYISWTATAHADGLLTVLHDERAGRSRHHGYLFYEGVDMIPHDWSAVTTVRREQIGAFLEENALLLGLIDREVTDFVTYWLPRMQEFDEVCVEFNSQLIEAAVGIEVSPPVDRMLRIFMVWTGNRQCLQRSSNPHVSVSPWQPPSPSTWISASNRSPEHSYLVEWGGVEMV